MILKNGKKLKGKDYSIGEDFSKNVRELRKKLWDSAKPNRDKKKGFPWCLISYISIIFLTFGTAKK